MSAQLDENTEQLQSIQEQMDGKDQEIETLAHEVCILLSILCDKNKYHFSIHSQLEHRIFIIIMCSVASLLHTHFWAVLFDTCAFEHLGVSVQVSTAASGGEEQGGR